MTDLVRAKAQLVSRLLGQRMAKTSLIRIATLLKLRTALRVLAVPKAPVGAAGSVLHPSHSLLNKSGFFAPG